MVEGGRERQNKADSVNSRLALQTGKIPVCRWGGAPDEEHAEVRVVPSSDLESY